MSTRLFNLPLGSRFRYVDNPDRTYVLLDRGGPGLVADAMVSETPKAFQGLYSAAESREEFETMLVDFVPVHESQAAASEAAKVLRVITSYSDLRRAEKECGADERIASNLSFLLVLRRGADSRDEFAKAAMQALLARRFTQDERGRPFVEWVAELAYEVADELLKVRES